MGKTKSKWIIKDDQTLEAGIDDQLQVKLDPTGFITKDDDGIKLDSGNNDGDFLIWSTLLNQWVPSQIDFHNITWKGVWSSTIDYIVDDAVTYNGSSYVCILDSINNTPSDEIYWQLLAAKGDTGLTPIVSAQQNDVTKVSDVNTLNFVGGVTVTDDGNGKATIDVTSQATFKYWTQPNTPPTPYAAGDMWYKTDSLYVYDDYRLKWLSADRDLYCYTSSNNVKNSYIPPFGNTNAASGIYIGRDCTLMSINGSSNGVTTVPMNIMSGTNIIYSWDWTNGGSREWQPINLDISAGTTLRLYVGNATLVCPLVIFKLAWRA